MTSRPRGKKSTKTQRTPSPQRRYLVKEIVSAMAWTGTVWACACSTRESALQCFDRRVTKNQLDRGDSGIVVAYDRERRVVIASTNEMSNRDARRWWFPVRQ